MSKFSDLIHPLSQLIFCLCYFLYIPLQFLFPYLSICSYTKYLSFLSISHSHASIHQGQKPLCWLYAGNGVLGCCKGRWWNVGRSLRYSGRRIGRIEWFGPGTQRAGMTKISSKCLAFVADWMLVPFTDTKILGGILFDEKQWCLF